MLILPSFFVLSPIVVHYAQHVHVPEEGRGGEGMGGEGRGGEGRGWEGRGGEGRGGEGQERKHQCVCVPAGHALIRSHLCACVGFS